MLSHCNIYAFTLQYLCFHAAISMLLGSNVYVIGGRNVKSIGFDTFFM